MKTQTEIAAMLEKVNKALAFGERPSGYWNNEAFSGFQGAQEALARIVAGRSARAVSESYVDDLEEDPEDTDPFIKGAYDAAEWASGLTTDPPVDDVDLKCAKESRKK